MQFPQRSRNTASEKKRGYGPHASDRHVKCDGIFSTTTTPVSRIKEKPMKSSASILIPIGSNQNRTLARLLALPFAFALLTSHLVAQGEPGSEDGWRRTTRGWEYAHAVPIVSENLRSPKNTSPVSTQATSARTRARSAKKSLWFVWQSYALPVAAGTFFVSFSWWLLIDVPNKAIVRRLN